MPRKVYKRKRGVKKTLTKRNIFGHKSAKSQAKQIYRLNKKINYIQKTTAPEICRYQNEVFLENMTDYNNALVHKNGVKSLFKDVMLNTSLDRHIEMNGDMLRMRYLELYGYFGTTNAHDITTDMWGGSTPTPVYVTDTHPWTAYLRIIVCKLKKSVQSVPLKITQEPDHNYGTGNINNYDVKPIIGPLINDLSSQLTVIKDKVIKIDNRNPNKLYKIKLYPKRLGYIYRNPPAGSNASTVGQNDNI